MLLNSIKTKRHTTAVLCVVWHQTEIFLHILKQAYDVEDRTLTKIYRKKKEKVKGGWRRVHKERHHDFLS